MSKIIDLTGQKFNKLTVIERDFSRKGVYWLCLCDCGNPELISVRGANLKSGNTKSCGCLNYSRTRAEDLAGQKFSKLTVIERDFSRKGVYWLCQCDCGNPEKISVKACNLKNGNTKSCGCLRGKNLHENMNDLTGKRFGKLKVLKQAPSKNNKIYWLCQCDCGSKPKEIMAYCLTSGKTSSCGCIKSKAEKLIEDLLMEMEIPFEKEKTFEDLKSPKNYLLRFDFYLPQENICLEYQGEQHFHRHFQGEEGLKNQQYNDSLKREYCKKKGINLIEIPYWDFDIINKDYLLKIIYG